MPRDCCMALPCGSSGLSEKVVVAFPDHAHYFSLCFMPIQLLKQKKESFNIKRQGRG